MAWLRKDPFKDGLRAAATLERVVVTDSSHDHSTGVHQPEVYLTFEFTDPSGALVRHERRLALEHVLPAGSRVDVAYLPDDLDSIDFDRDTVQPPDPDVPRGWSAGIFQVEDLGSHRSGTPQERESIDKQRELFRTGRRARAEVVSLREGDWHFGRRNEGQMIFDLRIDGTIVEAAAIVSYRPAPGDVIEVAISENGRGIAFDTDERYSGGPGQGLVFNPPA